VGDTGLGIDAFTVKDTSSPADYIPESATGIGVNENDTKDGDNGSNNLINYPVITGAEQDDHNLTIHYDLDAAGSPTNSYRVEFFASDTQGAFGHGPGQKLVGYSLVNPGKNLTATFTLKGNVTYKQLSATTTAVNLSLPSGFGETSEFSSDYLIATQTDSDGDGASNKVESAGPNKGDANNDGVADSQQRTVASFLNANDKHVTVSEKNCAQIEKTGFIDSSTLSVQDKGYVYPFGFMDMTLDCSYKGTARVTVYVYTDIPAAKLVLRKFNTASGLYSTIENVDRRETEVNENKVITFSYDITDGSSLDDDGTENGVIADPLGIASEDTSLVGYISPDFWAATGLGGLFIFLVGSAVIFVTFFSYRDYKRHRDPLIKENPNLRYTYWHYITVVSIPLVKHKFSPIADIPPSRRAKKLKKKTTR
jgi:hypothetical protein